MAAPISPSAPASVGRSVTRAGRLPMNEPQTVLEPSPPRRRRRRRWLGGLVLVFLAWLAAVYGFFAYRSDRDLREAVEEASRLEPGGWQLEDIEAQRARVP